jgi:Cu-Zn family superoxide dismutase
VGLGLVIACGLASSACGADRALPDGESKSASAAEEARQLKAGWSANGLNAGGLALAGAELKDANGKTVGYAAFIPASNGVLVEIRLIHAPPGRHAIHVHETGRCLGPSFASAGGHLNPWAHQHGFLNPAGPHAGDLATIEVPPGGDVRVDQFTPLLSLGDGPNSLLKAGGTSLVLHAGNDDYATDPAGGSGARIACGRIIHGEPP